MKQKSDDLFDKLSAHGISWTDPICHRVHHRVIVLGEDEDTVVEWAVKTFKLHLKSWVDLSLTPYSQKHNLSLKQAISVTFRDQSYNPEKPTSDLIQMKDLHWNGRGENFASALLSGKTEHDIEANDTIALLKQEVKELSQWKEAVLDALAVSCADCPVDTPPAQVIALILDTHRGHWEINQPKKEEGIQAPDFTIAGVEYTTVSDKGSTCRGCAFDDDWNTCCSSRRPMCLAEEREDKQEVIFIKKVTT